VIPARKMAHIEINSSEQIFDVLSADSAFSSLIGELEFPDGNQTALLVAVASDPLEGIDGASGLLVVIEKDPAFTSTRLLTDQVVVDRMFSIRLVQFPSDSRNLRAASERLLQLFPGTNVVPIAGPNLIAGEGQAIAKLPSNPVAHV